MVYAEKPFIVTVLVTFYTNTNVLRKLAIRYLTPADRGTKKHVYLPYRGTISFWFYLVPLRLVSIFLNVVRVEISCGLLPTRFSTILL